MSHAGPADPDSEASRSESALREHAMGYPGATEDFPWGHRAIKVAKKAFVFMGADEERLFVTVKLPNSNLQALDRPFTEPTGYGLGRSGWVSATFDADERPPLDLLRAWIDESYRAVAPKRLVAELDGVEPKPRRVRKP